MNKELAESIIKNKQAQVKIVESQMRSRIKSTIKRLQDRLDQPGYLTKTEDGGRYGSAGFEGIARDMADMAVQWQELRDKEELIHWLEGILEEPEPDSHHDKSLEQGAERARELFNGVGIIACPHEEDGLLIVNLKDREQMALLQVEMASFGWTVQNTFTEDDDHEMDVTLWFRKITDY